MINKSKELVHDLYNDLAKNNTYGTEDIKEVLIKVYKRLDDDIENIPLINRLANYITFTAFTNKIKFSKSQDETIRKLREIGQFAGLNGVYRSDYGNKNQF